MKNIFNYLIIILLLIGAIPGNQPVSGQSAIGQLETMSGQKINRTSASSISSANINNMVIGQYFRES
jgi:hypothetical protein